MPRTCHSIQNELSPLQLHRKRSHNNYQPVSVRKVPILNNMHSLSQKNIMKAASSARNHKADVADVIGQESKTQEVNNSQQYKDLVAKMKSFKEEKQREIQILRTTKDKKKELLKKMATDKAQIKMEMWKGIGRVCKLKDQIAAEKQRKILLDEYLLISRSTGSNTNHEQMHERLQGSFPSTPELPNPNDQ